MNQFNAAINHNPFHQQPSPSLTATASSASASSDSSLTRQTSLVVLSTVLGCIVAFLFAYIGYLHRAQWRAVLNRMKLQITSRKERIISPDASKPDSLVNRLDALEKALHNPTPPFTVNRRSGQSTSQSSSINKDWACDVRPASLLDMASPPAELPHTKRHTRQQSPGLSGNLGIEPRYTSSSCDPRYRSQPSFPAVGSTSSSHPTLYQHSLIQGSTNAFPAKSHAKYDDSRAASPSNYLLAGPPSLSLSLARDLSLGGNDSLEEDSCATVYQPSSPLPPQSSLSSASANCQIEGRISPVGLTHTPDSIGPNTPLTPAFNKEDVRVCDTQRGSLSDLPIVHITVDDIHEDIKRVYSSFLSMMEEGVFDTLSPSTAQTRLSALHSNSLRRLSQFAASHTRNSTRWTLGTNGEVDIGHLNSHFISMLLQDLTSGAPSEVDMPYPSAPSSTLGGDLNASLSQVQDSPVDDERGMENGAQSTTGLDASVQDYESEPGIWTTDSSPRHSFGEDVHFTKSSPTVTTPELSSSKSSPDLEAALPTPTLPPCPRMPSRIMCRNGWLVATDGSPPQPLTMFDMRPTVLGDITSERILTNSPESDAQWGFGRAIGIGDTPRSSQSTGSIYSRSTGEVRTSGSSSNAPDDLHNIALSPHRLLPAKRNIEHSRSIPFLNRQVYSRSIPRPPPTPILPSELDAVYPDASLVKDSEPGVDKLRASKTIIMGSLRNSFSKFATLGRKFTEGTPSPLLPSDLEKATNSIAEGLQHEPKRSKEMFVIGDDSDKSIESF